MATEKSHKKREHILEAALKRLMKYGYSKTTISEIARDVGLTKTGFYHYFPSKDALIIEIGDSFFDRYIVEVRAILRSEESLPDRLTRVIDARESIISTVFEEYNSMLEDMLHVIPILKDRKSHWDNEVIRAIMDEIQIEAGAGRITVEDPLAFSTMLLLFMYSTDLNYQNDGLSSDLRCSQPLLIKEFKAFVKRGMCCHEN